MPKGMGYGRMPPVKAKGGRKRPTLPAKASPKAVAAVAKPRAGMLKGRGHKR